MQFYFIFREIEKCKFFCFVFKMREFFSRETVKFWRYLRKGWSCGISMMKTPWRDRTWCCVTSTRFLLCGIILFSAFALSAQQQRGKVIINTFSVGYWVIDFEVENVLWDCIHYWKRILWGVDSNKMSCGLLRTLGWC